MMKRFVTWAGMSPVVHVGASALFIACIAALALFGNPSPVQSQFASQSGWGGTTSGSANAQTIAVPNYRLNVGVPITAIAGFSNTGSVTLAINGTGTVLVKRTTANAGVQNLVGGEFIAGLVFTVVYDGTFYKLMAPPDWVGSTIDVRTGTVPLGYAIEDGTCQSATGARFVALFSVIGTNFGTCGAGNFVLSDSRGRINAALDTQGSNGAANRINSLNSGCVFTGMSNLNCGVQSVTMTSTTQFPSYTPGITDTRTWALTGGNTGVRVQTGGPGIWSTTGGTGYFADQINNGAVSATSGAINGVNVGSSQPIPSLPPVATTIRAIKL